jgi:ketosteroid isomerase-like protein
VRESWRGLFERALVLRSRSEDLQVTVIGPTALVTCHETTSAFTSEGSTLSNAETTNIFEKLNGDWFLIHHQASPLSKAGDGFWIDFL